MVLSALKHHRTKSRNTIFDFRLLLKSTFSPG